MQTQAPVQQPTYTAQQPVASPMPFGFPMQMPEAGPSSSILLMLTFCVWLLRQQLRDSQ
ncbi:hypothetical protein [Baaleninema simplex]|uniref:hypothetical protein n=1 Tax=Baaleninema simplex TaxID=2862350 RepID=UPI00034AC2AB|nr:hypothetical protein [Baaleninema simplex]